MGGLLSLVAYLIILGYSMVQLVQLAQGKNPSITTT